MKKTVLFFGIIFLSTYSIYGQKAKFYVGFDAIQEVNLSVEFKTYKNLYLGGSMGYIYRLKQQTAYYWEIPIPPVRFINQKGYGTDVFIKSYGDLNWVKLSFEYRKLESGTYINNAKGRRDSFKESYVNKSVLLAYGKTFTKFKRLELFWEIGVTDKYINRVYLDPYDNIYPPEQMDRYVPTFRTGFSFRIL